MLNFFRPLNVLLSFALLVLLFHGCKKETVILPPPYFDYFPTEKGTYVLFDVDSVYHGENDDNNDDSVYRFHYQVKEVVDSTFKNGANKDLQVVVRYKRNDPTENWTLTNVWTQELNYTSAYRIENNVEYHKLAFPISSSTTWNGNDRNTSGEETYYYDSFHEQASFGNLSFDSTLTVIQIDENNYIERKFGNEVYAVGVGLVYKQRDDLGKKNGIIVSGLEYRMTVIDYGKE